MDYTGSIYRLIDRAEDEMKEYFPLLAYKFMPRMELAGLVTLMVAAGVWGMRRVMAVGTPETKGCV